MPFIYKVKGHPHCIYQPPKTYISAEPVALHDTIECDDGNWYHVLSITQQPPQPVLHVGPDGTSAQEAILLAQQMNESK